VLRTGPSAPSLRDSAFCHRPPGEGAKIDNQKFTRELFARTTRLPTAKMAIQKKVRTGTDYINGLY
jgi:hypothetical protein